MGAPKLVHEASGTILARDVSLARDVWSKARGLIGREPPSGSGVIIERAKQVHTFGVPVPIDVVFCDRDWVVLHVIRALRPRRISRWVRNARYIVELAAGSVPPQVVPGERLTLIAE